MMPTETRMSLQITCRKTRGCSAPTSDEQNPSKKSEVWITDAHQLLVVFKSVSLIFCFICEINPLVLRCLFMLCWSLPERGHKIHHHRQGGENMCSLHMRKRRDHPKATQIIRSDICRVQIRETRKKTNLPDRCLNICCNNSNLYVTITKYLPKTVEKLCWS